jgi:hypothetical protein
MRSIDLDPASCAGANENIRATQFYDIHMDGLVQVWFGCIWMNPPYARSGIQGKFVQKMIDEWKAGRVEQAIVLLNANSIASTWFTPLHDFPMCIKRSPRIEFIPATERQIVNPKRPGNDNVFVYLGPRIDAFVEIFETIGPVFTRAKPFAPTFQQQEMPMSDIPPREEHAKPDGSMPPINPPVNPAESAEPSGPKLVYSNRQSSEPIGAPTDIFADLDKLRRDSVLKAHRKVLTTSVTLGKPSPNVYFRCHPDLRLEDANIVKNDKGINDYYFIAPSMKGSPRLAKWIRRCTIALTYTWPSGEIGIWPVTEPPPGTKVKSWKSSKAAYEQSRTNWVQLVWNEERMDYDVVPPEGELPEPMWPEDLNLSAKLMLAFEGRVIDSDEHPFVLQLRGIIST